MKKNGRTFRQDCSLVGRGMKELERILPGQIKQIFVRAVLTAAIPFVATAVSAYLIDSLLENESIKMILKACFVGIGTTFVLSAWKAVKDSRAEEGFARLFSCHEIALTDKAYRLLYEELEKSGTRSLRDEVTGSLHISGAGMASLYWDMDTLFQSLAMTVFSSVIFFCHVYRLACWDWTQNRSLVQGGCFVLVTFLLIAVCSYITCKTSSKRFDVNFEVFQNGSQYIGFGDFYTRDYLLDENGAMDVRIYEPDDLILKECQEKCYEHFAKGKEEEMHAVNLYDGIKFISSGVCGCIVYLLVGDMAVKGAIGTGSILMMYAAVTMLMEALSQIAQIITDLRNNNEHLLRFFQYMDLPEATGKTAEGMAADKMTAGKTAASKTTAAGRISTGADMRIFKELEVRNVSFRYLESDTYALKNITFKLHAGERIAIVGENGSGKTTLIKLLCGLYQPSEGKIIFKTSDPSQVVDSTVEWNIAAMPFEEFIPYIATVFQDFSLFPFSLGENVAASEDYDAARVEASLGKAGLEGKVLQLRNGIRQMIFRDYDENGTDLSGGEQQKVAIARAVYKDAEIMILDEPTAALDPYAEYEIYRNFAEITKGKTLISISHRLSSCRMCDRILVLGEGKVLQEGSHEELLKDLQGKYYAMWTAQAQYYI